MRRVPWQCIAWALMMYRRWRVGVTKSRAHVAEWYGGLADLAMFEAFMEKRG